MVKGKDFMVLEMWQGRLRYVYNVGSGVRVLEPSKKKRRKKNRKRGKKTDKGKEEDFDFLNSLNDHQWHSVLLRKLKSQKHVLKVDGVVFTDHLPDSR